MCGMDWGVLGGEGKGGKTGRTVMTQSIKYNKKIVIQQIVICCHKNNKKERTWNT